MKRRQQPSSWIQRHSRSLLGAIALMGALVTTYLSFVELTGREAVCPTNGCNVVLSSPYAHLFGVPLPLFGLLGYLAMATLALGPLAVSSDHQDWRSRLEDWSWFLLFIGSWAMAIFSAYLVYLLVFEIQAFCPYCATSALMSLGLLVVTLLGHSWDDIGQMTFTGVIVVFVTLVGVTGLYATTSPSSAAAQETAGIAPPPIKNASGPSEIALAKHLKSIGATEYSAFWCPHCQQQREIFGKEAFAYIHSIECSPEGQDAQPQVCEAAGVKGYPTWTINGENYSGTTPLKQLADLSNYTGPRDFLYSR